jgi:hypothetical protein
VAPLGSPLIVIVPDGRWRKPVPTTTTPTPVTCSGNVVVVGGGGLTAAAVGRALTRIGVTHDTDPTIAARLISVRRPTLSATARV